MEPASPIEPSIAPLPAPEVHPFEFRGSTAEYFRIWIVNVALSILTLGVFSAWAKVRRERWFYGNTWVAGAPFEYLAKPIPILKGRAIAVVVLAVYVGAGRFLPVAQGIVAILVFLASPWLVYNSLRFRARYSGWRSLNFGFVGSLKGAFAVYLWRFLALIPTLGLAFPWVRHGQTRYTVEGHRFGGNPLGFGATMGNFYRVYAKAGALGVVLVLAVSGASAWVIGGITGLLRGMEPRTAQMIGGFTMLGLVYGSLIAAWVLVTTRLMNLTFNSLAIAGHHFRSTLRARDVLGLYVTNTLAVLASAGLLVPWARVRMARYRARHLTLLAAGPPDGFRGSGHRQQGAAGAETADFLDVDLSL